MDPGVTRNESNKLAVVGNQSQSQSPAAASGRLVYVRRKVEVDTNKAKEASAPTRVVARWEERYHHLQMLLNKLDNQSHGTDHHAQSKAPLYVIEHS